MFSSCIRITDCLSYLRSFINIFLRILNLNKTWKNRFSTSSIYSKDLTSCQERTDKFREVRANFPWMNFSSTRELSLKTNAFLLSTDMSTSCKNESRSSDFTFHKIVTFPPTSISSVQKKTSNIVKDASYRVKAVPHFTRFCLILLPFSHKGQILVLKQYSRVLRHWKIACRRSRKKWKGWRGEKSSVIFPVCGKMNTMKKGMRCQGTVWLRWRR